MRERRARALPLQRATGNRHAEFVPTRWAQTSWPLRFVCPAPTSPAARQLRRRERASGHLAGVQLRHAGGDGAERRQRRRKSESEAAKERARDVAACSSSTGGGCAAARGGARPACVQTPRLRAASGLIRRARSDGHLLRETGRRVAARRSTALPQRLHALQPSRCPSRDVAAVRPEAAAARSQRRPVGLAALRCFADHARPRARQAR
jgi:hypothetical protein